MMSTVNFSETLPVWTLPSPATSVVATNKKEKKKKSVIKDVPKPKHIGCSHEKEVFSSESRRVIVDRICHKLSELSDKFDAIAISGYSSATIGSIVADKLDKNIVLVRKESERRVSSYKVEGRTHQRVIFIDDLIDMGGTITRIYEGIKELDCTLVGFALYNSHYFKSGDTYDIEDGDGNTTVEVPCITAFDINAVIGGYGE